MPINYGSALYEVGARRGRVVGQGLMALGQGVTGALKERERKREKAEEKRFAKTVALLKIYTNVGDKI
jgi:hypothetical protein